MVISFSLSALSGASSVKSIGAATEPSVVKKSSGCGLSVFGVPSDSEDGGSDSSVYHPLSTHHELSYNSSVDSSSRVTHVAAECKPIRISYKDYDVSTCGLDPALYMYDGLDDCTKDDVCTNDVKNIRYLGCAPSDVSTTAKAHVVKDSQYMKDLLRSAHERQIERNIAFDKQHLKADLASGDSVTEVFVTGAYKRKLEERRRFEEERRRKDEEDVRNSGKGVVSLHAHMLKSGTASRSNRQV